MEVKKTPQANLENKKGIFLEIGFLVALGIVLLAFEWKVAEQIPEDFITVSDIPADIDMTPVTVMQLLPPPPPAPRLMDMIDVVEELEEVTDDLEIEDATDHKENTPQNFNIDNVSYGQEETDEVIAFLPSEDMPAFPGNVQKWIAQNVKYPQLAAENGIEGKVFVQFIVEKDGRVSNVKVVRSVDAYLDKEAIRVISGMPKWAPGKQRGKPVRVSYTMPIFFQLGR